MVFAFALVALVSVALKNRFETVLVAFALCMAVASIATPPDPASCLFIGILLFTAHQIGGRFAIIRHSGLRNHKIDIPAAEYNGDQVSNPYAPPMQSQTRTNK